MIAPRSVAGYVQSKGTAEGFQRMKRRGIVLPPFQIEQACAKAVMIELEEVLADFQKEALLQSIHLGEAVQDAAPLSEILIANLKERLKELAGDDKRPGDDRLRRKLSRQLADAQREFFKDFFEDAGIKVKTRVAAALDKDDVFASRLDAIRGDYLDESIKRINGGKSELRKDFIKMLDEWISGERPDLNGLTDIMAKIRKEGLNFSKYFARDQFSRLNASLAVASYDEAGAKKVKWVTVGDGRVRKEHKLRNGKIYPIDKIPDRGFNCRCGFIPVFD